MAKWEYNSTPSALATTALTVICSLHAIVAGGCAGLKDQPQPDPQAAFPSSRGEEDPTRRSEATRADTPIDFVRCLDVGRWECVLQTAVVTYTNAVGVSVSLVAAIHSADPNHFRDIQARLAAYQLVLYEGWTEDPQEAARAPDSEMALARFLMDSSNAVVTLLHDFLGFHHVDQWGAVDYLSANFLNVDMSSCDFARLCRERKEVLVQLGIAWTLLPRYVLSMLIRSVPRSWEETCRPLELPRDWYQAARYLYTRESAEMSNLLGAYNASRDAWSNVTIHARNALIEQVLMQRILEGARECAIYYGAVHIPDLERRLWERGFRKTNVDWIDCWDVLRLP